MIWDEGIVSELNNAGFRKVGQITDKSPAYLMHEVGLSAGRIKKVQEYLDRYGLSIGGYSMIFQDKCLKNGYTVRADSLNSFPFGLGISLFDEDGEEVYKYIFDLNEDPEKETLKVIDKICEVFRNNGVDGFCSYEEDELKCFILIEAERTVAEWEKTFDLKL